MTADPQDAPSLFSSTMFSLAPGITVQARERILQAITAELDRLAPPRMTYEAFLDWLDEDTLVEWEDGTVIMTSPANIEHQLINKFLLKLLDDYVEFLQLGKVIKPPFQMRLQQSGREPDLIFIATEHLDRLKPTYLNGPADVVVEIISPESATRDRAVKLREYRSAGIPEYWLIDPEERRAEFNCLDNQGHYQLAYPDAAGIFHSSAIAGFWLKIEWLWQEPKPNVQRLLREIGGDAYRQYLLSHLED